MVGAKSGVPGNLPANGIFSGIPTMPHRDWLRSMGTIPKIPEMRKTLSALEKRVRELEDKLAEK
jgi:UDP-3-O-[3-hydroxymyristoyl] glucosamine N-acyltransferase